MAKKKKKRSGGVSFLEKAVIIAVVMALLIFLVSQSRTLSQKNKEYVEKIESIEKDIAQEEKRAEEIKELESEVKTPEYAGKYAREHLGLVEEDEVIFKAEN